MRNQLVPPSHTSLLRAALLTALTLLHSSAWSAPSKSSKRLEEVEAVASRLIGSMDSSAQARKDPEYRDVRMTHCKVQVLEGPESLLKEAVFLYVEQAMNLALDRPYRQRFMRLSPAPSGSGVVSSVHEPSEPQRFTGLCTRPEASRTLKASELGRVDCSVLLRKVGKDYVGETPAGGCPSTHMGSSYMTSKAVLREDGMDSWDQGFDGQGKQVWGARKGPYEFRRVTLAYAKDILGQGSAQQLARWLSGSWSTEAQAQRDGRYMGYVDNLCTFTLQGEQPTQELFMFLDKAAAAAPAKPFRQQTISLRAQPDGTIEYRVLNDVKERARYVDFCGRPLAERTIAASELGEYRCSLLFRKVGEAYVASTGPEGCPGKFAGSASATTTLVVYEDGLMLASTRAFDTEGRQVWGIAGGPFEMRRVREYPLH
jgi:hypothetical protein